MLTSVLWSHEVHRVVAFGIPAVLIVLGAVWSDLRCDGIAGRTLVTVGDGSYSIYLFQGFALPALGLGLKLVGLRLPADVAILTLWLGATIAGMALWWIVERPMTNWLRGAVEARKVRSAAAPAQATT